VSLAACVAMLPVNLLLPLTGKVSDSFVMLDLMRLPLGILSGIGFIGAGAIVRRDNFVAGVTLKLVEQQMKQGRVAKLLIVTGAKANETKVPDEVHALLARPGTVNPQIR
jgi:hypothetical protein